MAPPAHSHVSASATSSAAPRQRRSGEKHADEDTAHVLQRFAKMGTIDLRIAYLRPGIGSAFTASAEVTRLGGRIGATQMRLVNDQGSVIATGAAAYVIS